MRQSGLIAAGPCTPWSITAHGWPRTTRTRGTWPRGIAGLPGIECDPATVETNMVVFNVTRMPAPALVAKLKDAGVLLLARDERSLRAVTHLDVSRDQIDQAIGVVRRICS